MNSIFPLILTAIVFVTPVIAQQLPTEDDVPELTQEEKANIEENAEEAQLSPEEIEERKASIPVMEKELAQLREELPALRDELVTLNDKVMAKSENITATVSKLKDSKDSKIDIALSKQEAMKGLSEAARAYQRERRDVLTATKDANSGITIEDAKTDSELFNASTNAIVDDILEISKSFTAKGDFDEFTKTTVNYGLGVGFLDYADNPDFEQNEREVKQTEKQRKELTAQLDESKQNVEERINLLESLVERADITDKERETYQLELKQAREQLKQRDEQLTEAITAENVQPRNDQRPDDQEPSAADLESSEPETGTTPVSESRAEMIDEFVTKGLAEMQTAQQSYFTKYQEFKKRRIGVRKLETNLAARKEWLVGYEAKGE